MKRQTSAIDSFAQDISCLNDVYRELNTINFFEVLKISEMEIRHSNMLSWLLDPKGTSGFGDKLLKQFALKCIEGDSKMTPTRVELLDFDDAIVEREVSIKNEHKSNNGNIDILISSRNANMVICIENKINSKEIAGNDESEGQLSRYYKYVEDTYSEYKYRYYIFLSPSGMLPKRDEDKDIWKVIDYDEVCSWIQSIKNIYRSNISDNAELFISQYVDIIRKRVLYGELSETCDNIYMKHIDAFEIFESFAKGLGDTKGDEYALYLKHKDAINTVLDRKTTIDEKIKRKIAEVLKDGGYVVDYNPKKACIYVKVPKKYIKNNKLVSNDDSIDNDYLHFRVYITPGNVGIWFNLHTNVKNKPKNIDALSRFGEILEKEVKDATILKSLTLVSQAEMNAYKDRLGNNEPSMDDEFYSNIIKKLDNYFEKTGNNSFNNLCERINEKF